MLDMSPAVAVASPVKSRRRQVAKVAPATCKVKTAVHLSPDAFKRLGIAAVMEGRTQSDVIEALIVAGLRRYVVSDRAKSDDRVDSATEVVSAN